MSEKRDKITKKREKKRDNTERPIFIAFLYHNFSAKKRDSRFLLDFRVKKAPKKRESAESGITENGLESDFLLRQKSGHSVWHTFLLYLQTREKKERSRFRPRQAGKFSPCRTGTTADENNPFTTVNHCSQCTRVWFAYFGAVFQTNCTLWHYLVL